MSVGVAELLQKRLIFVTGKGGVGKTTVATALGLAAARLGLRSLVVELGESAEIPTLLGQPQIDGSEEPVALDGGLFHHRLIPEVALGEYLELQLRVRSLVRIALHNPGIRRLMEAAPGWRDLIRLGKLWYLETRKGAESPHSPVWDLLIIDAPATGHGLTLFSIPDAVVDTVRAGPLRRHAGAVQQLMHDPTRTVVLPVTLPEELPVRETIELVEGLEARGLATAAPIVNRIHPIPGSTELLRILEQLDAIPPGLPDPAALRTLLQAAHDRAKKEQESLITLRDCVGVSLELPRLDPPPQSPDSISELVRLLGNALRPNP